MIPVKFININPDTNGAQYWDQNLIKELLDNPIFSEEITDGGCSIVVIAGSQHVDYVDEINRQIQELKGVVLIITGDEEGNFPLEKLSHPNMKLWIMAPQVGRLYKNVDKFIGFGHTPHSKSLPGSAVEKNKRWFFAGQVNQSRRKECVSQLRKLEGGDLIETKSFASGLNPQEYIERMSKAKVVLCPGAPVTPDSFRFYEALEAGCIPILDNASAKGGAKEYWNMVFGDNFPVPKVDEWDASISDVINFYNDTFLENVNKIGAWWIQYKRSLLKDLIVDYASVSGGKLSSDGITVVIPTSPTESHPDTAMLEHTISTIRTHLPNVDIIITFDGVRPEQSSRKEAYQEYTRRVIWKCNQQWQNVIPVVFDEHMHQVAMMREALKLIHTDKVLYVEHDTPITPDMEIPFEAIGKVIDSGTANLVRFHYESFIPKEHKHLMLDKSAVTVLGSTLPMVRTVQWSQRPHLASTAFYREILEAYFTPQAKTFIEDKMHGVVMNAWNQQQVAGWNKFKLWIYHPEGNIKRSYHTDGRGSESKYEMIF